MDSLIHAAEQNVHAVSLIKSPYSIQLHEYDSEMMCITLAILSQKVFDELIEILDNTKPEIVEVSFPIILH